MGAFVEVQQASSRSPSLTSEPAPERRRTGHKAHLLSRCNNGKCPAAFVAARQLTCAYFVAAGTVLAQDIGMGRLATSNSV